MKLLEFTYILNFIILRALDLSYVKILKIVILAKRDYILSCLNLRPPIQTIQGCGQICFRSTYSLQAFSRC